MMNYIFSECYYLIDHFLSISHIKCSQLSSLPYFPSPLILPLISYNLPSLLILPLVNYDLQKHLVVADARTI